MLRVGVGVVVVDDSSADTVSTTTPSTSAVALLSGVVETVRVMKVVCSRIVAGSEVTIVLATVHAGVTYIVVGKYTVLTDSTTLELMVDGSAVAGAATTATCGSKRTESGYDIVVLLSICVCVTVTRRGIVVVA